MLQINGQVLHGRSHLNASAMIKSVTSNKVKIVLLRRSEQDYLSEMAVKPLKLPPIQHRVSGYHSVAGHAEVKFDASTSLYESVDCLLTPGERTI